MVVPSRLRVAPGSVMIPMATSCEVVIQGTPITNRGGAVASYATDRKASAERPDASVTVAW